MAQSTQRKGQYDDTLDSSTNDSPPVNKKDVTYYPNANRKLRKAVAMDPLRVAVLGGRVTRAMKKRMIATGVVARPTEVLMKGLETGVKRKARVKNAESESPDREPKRKVKKRSPAEEKGASVPELPLESNHQTKESAKVGANAALEDPVAVVPVTSAAETVTIPSTKPVPAPAAKASKATENDRIVKPVVVVVAAEIDSPPVPTNSHSSVSKVTKVDSGVGSQSSSAAEARIYTTPSAEGTAAEVKQPGQNSTYTVLLSSDSEDEIENEANTSTSEHNLSTSTSFLDVSDDGPSPSPRCPRDNYNITLFEDYDDGYQHRKEKAHAKWASDSENITEQAFFCRPDFLSQVTTTSRKFGDPVFPAANPKSKLFPNAVNPREREHRKEN